MQHLLLTVQHLVIIALKAMFLPHSPIGKNSSTVVMFLCTLFDSIYDNTYSWHRIHIVVKGTSNFRPSEPINTCTHCYVNAWQWP